MPAVRDMEAEIEQAAPAVAEAQPAQESAFVAEAEAGPVQLESVEEVGDLDADLPFWLQDDAAPGGAHLEMQAAHELVQPHGAWPVETTQAVEHTPAPQPAPVAFEPEPEAVELVSALEALEEEEEPEDVNFAELPPIEPFDFTMVQPPEAKKVKSLIVDDQPENLLSAEAVLESLRQEIVCAQSGREALRHFSQ